MKTYAIRLRPGNDLRLELEKFVKVNSIKAGFILTCTGSLKQVKLRLANETIGKIKDKLGIVSLVGTLSLGGLHLHISVSDDKGDVVGGHLKHGCLVYTTAEIVIGELDGVTFSRDFDDQTGYKELKISPPQ